MNKFAFMKSLSRILLLLLFCAYVACSPSAEPKFEWSAELEQLKSKLLSKACSPEHQAFFEKLIESQSQQLSYEEMKTSMQNMLNTIRCK